MSTIIDGSETLSNSEKEAVVCKVILSDGTSQNLTGMSIDELHQLQWEEEQRFAQQIVQSGKNSAKRQEITAVAYDTITTILAQMQAVANEPLVMGWDQRYERLVLNVLDSQRKHGLDEPSLFEIGYSSGALLEKVNTAGYEVGGIEVSPKMYDAACLRLPEDQHEKLKLGGFLQSTFDDLEQWYSVVYWNDVFEHIPVDEIQDYLAKIYSILAPGGCLISITPNWHERPNDVTGDFTAPRTEARGFHLKEYTLREVTDLLIETGFQTVETPLLVTPYSYWKIGAGAAGVKRKFEPLLEYLPFRLAQKMIHLFGMSCTIATKPS